MMLIDEKWLIQEIERMEGYIQSWEEEGSEEFYMISKAVFKALNKVKEQLQPLPVTDQTLMMQSIRWYEDLLDMKPTLKETLDHRTPDTRYIGQQVPVGVINYKVYQFRDGIEDKDLIEVTP
jgi:hypothetical protein